MQREFSAGGVLVRRLRGAWHVAAIRPAGKPDGIWALPKGHIDPGESGVPHIVDASNWGPVLVVRALFEQLGL